MVNNEMAVVKPNLADRALAGWRDQAAPITRKSVFLRIRRHHGDPTLDGNGWTPTHQATGLTAGAIMTHYPASQQMPTALAERAEPRTYLDYGDASPDATEPAFAPGGRLREDAGTLPSHSERVPSNVDWPPRGRRLTRHDIDFGSYTGHLRRPTTNQATEAPEETREISIPAFEDARRPRAGDQRARNQPAAQYA